MKRAGLPLALIIPSVLLKVKNKLKLARNRPTFVHSPRLANNIGSHVSEQGLFQLFRCPWTDVLLNSEGRHGTDLYGIDSSWREVGGEA
jgi:hypothetical protein